jgi:hypothetical protein
MKTIVSGLITIVITALFHNCSTADAVINGGDTVDYVERASPVEYVTITSKGGSQVTFMTHALWGNSCGVYSRPIVSSTGSEYSIMIMGKQRNDAVCLTVMTLFDAPVTVFLPSPGAYRFKFWRSDTTAIDTTFTVK